jgi:hypothetical protein
MMDQGASKTGVREIQRKLPKHTGKRLVADDNRQPGQLVTQKSRRLGTTETAPVINENVTP